MLCFFVKFLLFLYIIRDLYNNGSRTTKIFEKLGRTEDLCREMNLSRDDLIAWARNYAKEHTLKEKLESQDVFIPFSSNKLIEKDIERKFQLWLPFSPGYLLFLEN